MAWEVAEWGQQLGGPSLALASTVLAVLSERTLQGKPALQQRSGQPEAGGPKSREPHPRGLNLKEMGTITHMGKPRSPPLTSRVLACANICGNL